MRAILTVSIQGSGKSTYAKYLEKTDSKIKRATKDDLRFMIYDINSYSKKYEENTKLFGTILEETYFKIISAIIRQGLTVIVDETNHTRKERAVMLKFLRSTYPGIKVEAHYLYSSLDRCLARNIKRRPEQIVPESVVRRYYEELIASLGGSAEPYPAVEQLTKEGFDVVQVINAEQMEPTWNLCRTSQAENSSKGSRIN